MWYPAETRSVLPIELAVGLLVPGGWPDAMGEPKRRPQLDFGVRMARLRTNFGNGNGGKERRRRRVTAPLSVWCDQRPKRSMREDLGLSDLNTGRKEWKFKVSTEHYGPVIRTSYLEYLAS